MAYNKPKRNRVAWKSESEEEKPVTGTFFGGMVPSDQLPPDHPEKVREREEQEKKQ